MAGTGEATRELTIRRTFDAPREAVWKAWTDPETVAKWWGPRGVSTPTCEIDPRAGGRINIVMLAGRELGPAEGQRWPLTGTFTEVIPQSRLVIVSEARDDTQDLSFEHQITVEFSENGGKTDIVLHILITKVNRSERTQSALKGMEYGWAQSMEKLGETVEG